MPVIKFVSFEAQCDGDEENCRTKTGLGDPTNTEEEAIEAALKAGWLRKGRKLYCPKHRGEQPR